MRRYILILILIGALIVLTAKKIKASPVVAGRVEQYRPLAYQWGKTFDVTPELVLSHIAVETGGDPSLTSSAGAIGLMQILPTTLPDINQMLGTSYTTADLFDPGVSIQCGTAYLHWLLMFFHGDVALAVRAYNQGPGTISRDPTQGQDYLDKVSAYFAYYTGGSLA